MPNLTNIDELMEADGESLQRLAKQIVNRINEIRQRRLELSAHVHEDEGLRDEFAALRTMADTVKKLIEAQ